MLIAVATSSGQDVDLHFGRASHFTLFEVTEQSACRLKDVEVAQYCTSDPDHTEHEQRFSAIAKALNGCRAVVSVQIGDLPRVSLAEAGIQAFTAQGPVEDALHNAFVLLSAGGC
jgi:predicted Fe-Mo cluster-binding NifX family protein